MKLIGTVALGIALVGVAVGAQGRGVAQGQSAAGPARFVALAVNMGNTWSGSGAATVEIDIERWSSKAQGDRLLAVLKEKGPDALLDALRDLPRVGFIRTPGSLGYDLHYARREPLDEGGERVIVATDRPITFWEAANRPRTIDYPFTLIELRLDRQGEGEGKLSVATKVTIDAAGKTIELENYGTQPVQLRGVRRESKR